MVTFNYILILCTLLRYTKNDRLFRINEKILELQEKGMFLGKKRSQCFGYIRIYMAFQVVLVVKNLLASAGDMKVAGSIPVSERSPGGGRGNPLQYSCLKNAMDRGAWQATVHGVAKSWTWLTNTFTFMVYRWRNVHIFLKVSIWFPQVRCIQGPRWDFSS